MLITVAICTWNRAELLRNTLSSFTELHAPADLKWELVVVDNNCTDATPAVLDQFQQRLPLRVVQEPQQGHSVSRNRAVAESRGEYILWTDDDVRVSPVWLQRYRDAFVGSPSDVGFWGGTIEPLFESPPPRWLEENWRRCAGIFAVRDFGDEVTEFTERRLPFGANFAIRGELQRRYGYDPRFGRVSDVSVRGYDEIDVLRRVLEAGFRGLSVPEATLQHFIPTQRMSLQYVRQFYEGQGETWVLRGESPQPTWQLAATCLGHELAYRCGCWHRSTARWFDHLVKASRARGQWRKQRRRHSTPASLTATDAAP